MSVISALEQSAVADQAVFRITLDVTLNANGEDHEFLGERMNSAVYRAIMADGSLTKDSGADVAEHSFETVQIDSGAAALDEKELANWLSDQLESGAILLEDVPAMMARLALGDPGKIRHELFDKMNTTRFAPESVTGFEVATCFVLSPITSDSADVAHGPFADFDHTWMCGSSWIMKVEAGRPPILALEEMMDHADIMSRDIYGALMGRLNEMKQASASGQVSAERELDHLHEMNIIEEMTDASPWMMDPAGSGEVLSPTMYFASPDLHDRG